MSGDIFGAKANTVNTSGSSAPWVEQQPYLLGGYQQAQSIYNRGPYQGPYITPQSSLTPYAQQLTVQKAQDPNSLTSMSQSQLGDTISGKYLTADTNPYFQQNVNDSLGLARAQFNSQYGGQAGNNLTNAGFQEALTRNLGTAATNAYSQNYARERQNQLQATQLAPTLDYANIDRIAGVGAQQEARGQAEIGAQQAQYQAPWENLNQYMQAINRNAGNATTAQSPYYTNPTANAFGTALSAATLYKMFSGNGQQQTWNPYQSYPGSEGGGLAQADYSAGYY